MKSGGKYATALLKLRDAIQRVDRKLDCEKIVRLAGVCSKLPAGPTWSLKLDGFSFPVTTGKEGGLDHVQPKGVVSYKALLTVEASGIFSPPADTDPLQHLAVNVIITNLPGGEPDSIFCAWHLDSHPPKEKENRGSKQEEKTKKQKEEKKQEEKPKKDREFAHPRYHWQYGGKEVWGNDKAFFGSHLLLESPRLPHPPLDVVLAVDFVFAHYYGEQWRKLRKDTEYQRIVKEAQEMYWRPYFATIYANWNRAQLSGKPIDLMPFFYP